MHLLRFGRIGVVFCFLVGVMGMAAEAVAQVTVTAPPGFEVFAVISKGKVPAATVGANGTATIDFALIDAGKSVDVMIADCQGRMVMVLVEEGRRDEDCESRDQAGKPKCGCRRAAVIIWGRARALTVSPSGQVTVAEGPSTTDGGGSGLGWLIDVDFGSARMNDAEKSCDEVRAGLQTTGLSITCAKDATIPSFSVDAGITFARFLAVKVGYLQLGEVTLEASGSSGTRTLRQTGFFGSTRGVTFVGLLRIPLGPVVPYVEGGVWRWSAESGSTIDFTVGNQTITETFDQDDSGADPIFGGGVEIWFSRIVGISAGVKSVRLSAEADNDDEGDVDERFTTFFVGLKLGRR
jgi:hypothetical protein